MKKPNFKTKFWQKFGYVLIGLGMAYLFVGTFVPQMILYPIMRTFGIDPHEDIRKRYETIVHIQDTTCYPLWIEDTYKPFELVSADTVIFKVNMSIKYMLDPTSEVFPIYRYAYQLQQFDSIFTQSVIHLKVLEYGRDNKYLEIIDSRQQFQQIIEEHVKQFLKKEGFVLCYFNLFFDEEQKPFYANYQQF